MNLKQYVLTALAVSALTMPWTLGVSQAAAADASAQAATVKTAAAVSSATAVKADTAAKSDEAAAKAKQVKYSLKFNAKNYTKETLQLDGKDVAFRAYRNVVYVSKPASVAAESMSIFIPEAYFQKAERSMATRKRLRRSSCQTASAATCRARSRSRVPTTA